MEDIRLGFNQPVREIDIALIRIEWFPDADELNGIVGIPSMATEPPQSIAIENDGDDPALG